MADRAMTATKHRRDDVLLLDGQPRSTNRKPRRSRSKPTTPPLSAADAELREETIRSGDVFVTKLDGSTEVRSITGQARPSASVRGKRKMKSKPATPRDRELTKLKPTTPAKTKTTKRKRRSKSRKGSVDQFATTAKGDRPLTAEQRSELAALARNPYLNFDNWQTLTRGQADRLIPRLRKLAKQRTDAHLSKRKRRRTEVVK
jgi:hypothetical protein